MTIEFSCAHCGRIIRADNAATGKKGKCPRCGQTITVPQASVPDIEPLKDFLEDAPLPTLPPLEANVLPEISENPLGWIPPQSKPTSSSPALNPYVSSGPGDDQPATAPRLLMIPAILLFLVALVSIASNIYRGIDVASHPEKARLFLQPETQEQARAVQWLYVVFGVGGSIIGMVVNGGVMFAALQMIRLRSFNTAKTGAILAMIPCCSLFCLNMPLGLWALIVLLQPDVAARFR